ncbi:MAG: 2,3-diaminopropionate biosynthesis protein SbnB [Candidatus Parabeggiatoa sp.]|nr:2,3-diaminopropionate biosynthesis protein SbnB [Candidatus Parabeggiatoa sp.]
MQQKTDILILKQQEIESLLNKQENKIMDVVQQAYELHAQGKSTLPHSSFLTFPNDMDNRIIALPAYLGEPFNVAGIKWIASFPANIEKEGVARASAVLILNSMTTGHPFSIMESSIISAKRTAASAALAAKNVVNEDVIEAGFIGCGLINFEIFRFLSATFKGLKTLTVFDKQPERAAAFVSKVQDIDPNYHLKVATSAEQVLESTPLISLATTAATPYIDDLPVRLGSRTILLISLRDISPKIISTNINIVDDIDHVCRANTSIHLAQQQEGNTHFIKGTLIDVIQKRLSLREKSNETIIFSPFGLGVLDIALGKFIYDVALANNIGTKIDSFIGGEKIS